MFLGFSVRKSGGGGGDAPVASQRTGHCAGCRHGASSSIRRTPPQTRQACYGRGHPVNDSDVTDVTERHRQPTTALTVMIALHPHLINPNHHLPRATQKSQRRFWSRAPCHARLCDRLNLRASPLTGHCAGGRRGASSAFAEPLTVHSLASAATLSTAPTRGKPVDARERTSRRRPAAGREGAAGGGNRASGLIPRGRRSASRTSRPRWDW